MFPIDSIGHEPKKPSHNQSGATSDGGPRGSLGVVDQHLCEVLINEIGNRARITRQNRSGVMG